ncbi:MAG: tetratricopeptide repeat protein [Sumerlaeia bacterium]
MSVQVMLALTMAAGTAIFLLGGSGPMLLIPLSSLTIILSIMGLNDPGDEDPKNGRTAAIFCIIIALLPLAKPYFIHLANQRAERQRANETAPLYQKFNQQAKTIAPVLREFNTQHGAFPTIDATGKTLPLFGTDYRLIDITGSESLGIPQDPFDPARTLTVFPIGNQGALLMSVGQDAVQEFPNPKNYSSLDGPQAHPMAPLASAGLDLRTRLYDPTNGALANGDLLTFIPANEQDENPQTLEEVLQPLFTAWKKVDSLTPKPPSNLPEGTLWPPAEDDAQTAADMFQDENYLAALAASSRAVLQRRSNSNFWKTPQLKKTDWIKGRALFELGHVRAAADSFVDYTSVDPNDPLGHYWLGIALYYAGSPKEAQQHLTASYQLDPTFPEAKHAIELEQSLLKNQPPPPNTPFPSYLKSVK